MTKDLQQVERGLGSTSQSPAPEKRVSSTSRVFVSLNVMIPAMKQYHRRRPPLTRSTAKVLVRVSLGMFLALLLLFLVVYTVILVYVDKHFNPPFVKSPSSHKKFKLKGKLAIINAAFDDDSVPPSQTHSDTLTFNGVDSDQRTISGKNNHRKQLWNSSLYYSSDENLPQCRWQTLFRVLITSAPSHFDQRQAIRFSWCNPSNFPEVSRHAWSCIFVIGDTTDASIKSAVQEEKANHQDILLGNYMDSYQNLTLKVIHAFDFGASSCPSSYLLKTDDDCFVNAGLLHTFLLHHNTRTNDLYAGSILKEKTKLRVVRGDFTRWTVSEKDFPHAYYPPYASGMGYILSADVVRKLVLESQFYPLIPIEDAYVGIVLSSLKVEYTDTNRFQLSRTGLGVCNYLYVFVVHHVLPKDQKMLMSEALKAPANCNYSLITEW